MFHRSDACEKCDLLLLSKYSLPWRTHTCAMGNWILSVAEIGVFEA